MQREKEPGRVTKRRRRPGLILGMTQEKRQEKGVAAETGVAKEADEQGTELDCKRNLSKTGDIMEDKEQKVRASQSVRVRRDPGDHLIQLTPSASMSLAETHCTHTHSHLWTFAYAVPFTLSEGNSKRKGKSIKDQR